MFDLRDKVALVTGGSRGIGKAVAAALADCGATVCATATSEAGAEKISGDLGDRGKGYVLNVSDAESVDAALAAIAADFAAPTILVNNAGIARDQLMLRMKDEDWDAVMDTNLRAVFRLCRLSLRPMMKARFGRIINMGSVIGALGNPGQASYAAAKAGMVGLTRSIAREVGSRGITANVIAPGFIETDMTASMPEAQRDAMLAQIPVGQLGAVDDIATAACYLASTEARYVTGHTLHVNGGMYMG
jgi:3-oxoacyl-[acyl-carrier protein] reductase